MSGDDKEYKPPELEVKGSLQELTLGGTTDGSDNLGGSLL